MTNEELSEEVEFAMGVIRAQSQRIGRELKSAERAWVVKAAFAQTHKNLDGEAVDKLTKDVITVIDTARECI